MKPMQGLAAILLCLALVATGAGAASAEVIHTEISDGGDVATPPDVIASETATNAKATGIKAEPGGDVTNAGTISGTALGAKKAEALGIEADELGTVLNTAAGSISATATANATDGDAKAKAIKAKVMREYAKGEDDSSSWTETTYHALTNHGLISAAATGAKKAEATGIEADEAGDFAISGTVSAVALSEGDNGDAKAKAIKAKNVFDSEFSQWYPGFDYYSYDYGEITNTGAVSAIARGTKKAEAAGIEADNTGTVSNSGTVGAAAVSAGNEDGKGDARATGIKAKDIYAGGWYEYYNWDSYWGYAEIMNTGTVSALAMGAKKSTALGIEAKDTGVITNDGAIEALAMSSGVDGDAKAKGLKATDIHGNSDMLVFAMMPSETNSIVNTGDILAEAYGAKKAEAFGIEAEYTDGIHSSGAISATAQADGENGDAKARGLKAKYAGTVTNEGGISASAFGTNKAEAFGIETDDIYGDIDNSGVISVASNGRGFGIVADGSYGATRAKAIEENGYEPMTTITNTGAIIMDAEEGAGIHIKEGLWFVENPGFISTSQGVRTLHVEGAGATLSGPFRIIFDGSPESDDYLAPIFLDGSSTLDLGGATLLAQAGDGIVWNTPYPVIENDASTVIGGFGGLQSPNPNIAASWADVGGTGEDAAVVFEYAPTASAEAQALRMANLWVMQVGNLIQQRTFSELLARYVSQQETLLADSGQVASDSGFLVASAADGSGGAAFIRPYLHTVNRPSDGGMGHGGSLLGIVAGYEWFASRDLTMGVHAGLGLGSIDFKGRGYDANEEQQQLYSVGLQGAYNPGAWHFDGSATLYAATHEYQGLTGGGLTIEEHDDYTSFGAEAEAIGGYVLSSGNWAAMPYLGLGYSWINAPGHSSDADNPAWNTRYSAVDEHVARSILGGQLSGNWAAGKTRIIPTLGLRWEYALTGDEISVSQALPGSGSVEVDDEVNRSSFIADASVAFVKGATSMELGATSLYNDDFTSNGGWMTLKWKF